MTGKKNLSLISFFVTRLARDCEYKSGSSLATNDGLLALCLSRGNSGIVLC